MNAQLHQQFGIASHNCIEYRGYYIVMNHDDSHIIVTKNLHDSLKTTSLLFEAYLFIDELIDGPKK